MGFEGLGVRALVCFSVYLEAVGFQNFFSGSTVELSSPCIMGSSVCNWLNQERNYNGDSRSARYTVK